MEMILTVILAALIILALVIVIMFLNKSGNKSKFRSDVHISGGVDVETGQMKSDNNYFKGMGNDLRDTVVVNSSKQKTYHIALVDLSSESQEVHNLNLTDRIVLGRACTSGVLTIKGDPMISHQHCALYISGGNLYIEDLNSANHTFLNDDIVLKPQKCSDGDLIRIGQTNLMIQM